MKLKLKVKKEDYQSILPALFVMLGFGAFSIPVLYMFFSKLFTDLSLDNFMYTFEEYGIMVLFSLVFFSFDVYFVYLLFKRPKKYLATLTSIHQSASQNITSMTFITKGHKERYKCYADGIYNLEKGQEYVILIKEFNHHIRYVEDVSINQKENVSEEGIGITIKPIIFGITFIFGSMALFILAYSFYTQNWISLIGLIVPLPFLLILYFIYKSTHEDTTRL